MTTPEYWGNQSVLFSKSWQDKLFCQIEGVSPSEHDIAINYIDIREQQLPPVLARLDGAELFEMQRKDVFIIHGENDKIIGFVCLSFQELDGDGGARSVYTGIDYLHILPEYREQYSTLTISCMLAFALGKYMKPYLLARDHDKVTFNITCESDGDDEKVEAGRYFYRIFKGQCKSPISDNAQQRQIGRAHV